MGWRMTESSPPPPLNVVLHVGAHRTGTTSLQGMLAAQKPTLEAAGIQTWCPDETRTGLFGGLFRHPSRLTRESLRRARQSAGRAQMRLALAEIDGFRHLIVSEENMIGCIMDNLSTERLYAQAGDRLARFVPCVAGRKVTIALSIRSYDSYWASALTYGLLRGRPVPSVEDLDRLVTQPRRWRHVAQELMRAFPQARVVVWPFETFVGQPEAQLSAMLGGWVRDRLRIERPWRNASPGCGDLRRRFERDGRDPTQIKGEGRWNPFDAGHLVALRAQYREDLRWFRSATLPALDYYPDVPEKGRWPDMKEVSHDNAEGRLAQAG